MTSGQGESLARARAVALRALRAQPIAERWQAQAARLAAAFVGTAMLGTAVALATSLTDWGSVGGRLTVVVQLVGLALVAGTTALAPRLLPARLAVVALTPMLMAELVVRRGAGLPSLTPEWVCSTSHVALGLLPLSGALWALRQCAWRWQRALVAGIGAGTAGALLGELVCVRGARHVLVYHLGAWLTIVVACVLISRLMRSRSFAP